MSSQQEQMSYLTNIVESLKGFTNEDKICTPLGMQILIEKFSEISDRRIDDENISLLVMCCLKYIDFLLQSPEILNTIHSQHKRRMHDYFSILGDIGSKIKLNNKFLKEIAVPILERIIDPSVNSLYGRELASNLNRIAQNSDRHLRNKIIERSARIYIYKLTDVIETCGDYEYQTCLVETLFRMCSRDFIFKNIEEFFPKAKDLQKYLLNIKVEDFDRNLRKFLNAVNHVNKNVFSIVVSSAFLDEFVIEPPVSDAGYNMELWVDFNILSCTIGIFCNKNSFVIKPLSQKDEWELLTFFGADISFVQLKREKVNSKESFQFSVLFYKNTTCHHTFRTSAEAASANILKLIIQDDVDNLKDILSNMFKGKFEAFKEISQDSQVWEYYTPESMTTINPTDKKLRLRNSQLERLYANILLCRNDDEESNIPFVQHKTETNKIHDTLAVFTNEMANHVVGNEEDVESYNLQAQEENSIQYMSCKEFEVIRGNSGMLKDCSPELTHSVTGIDHINKRRIWSDGYSEKSYADVLLCQGIEKIATTNTNHEKHNTLRVFTNEKINDIESSKEHIESYNLSTQEENSVEYFSNKKSVKSINECYYLSLMSPPKRNIQNFIELRKSIVHDNLVKVTNETDLVPEEDKLKSLSFEHNHSSLVEFTKSKKSRKKKQPIKIKMPFAKLKTNINKNTELPLIKEGLSLELDLASQNTENEKAIVYETLNKSNLETCNQSQAITSENKLQRSKKYVKLKKNVTKTLKKKSTVLEKQNECSNEQNKMETSQDEDPRENQLDDLKKLRTQSSFLKCKLGDKKQNLPVVIVERCDFKKYFSESSSMQILKNKKQTCIDAKEIDDESISSSIFNVSTQKFESQEDIHSIDKILLDMEQESNELKQSKLMQIIFTNDIGKKQDELSPTQHNSEGLGQNDNKQKTVSSSTRCVNRETDPILKTDLIENEFNSFLNTTENKLKLNETSFDQPHTIVHKSRKRKLYTYGDLSYLETEKEADSTDSEITVSKTIVTTALVHEPVRHTLKHKQNQTSIKNNASRKDLDSINVTEDIAHCDKKQADFNKENVNGTKVQRTEQENVNLKKIEVINEISTPNNEKNKQCYLLNQEINHFSDKNRLATRQIELFTKCFHSNNDSKSKKARKADEQLFKNIYRSGNTKQYLQKTDIINVSNKDNNDRDAEMYITHTSCFDDPKSKQKRKSFKSKISCTTEVKQFSSMRKRKKLDYSEAAPAKHIRIFNEPTANNKMKNMKRKCSNIKTILDGNEMKNLEVPRVKILQNIILQSATNLINNNTDINGFIETEECVQNNNFRDANPGCK